MPDPFVHTFRVRYHECDAQGIVFNANWLTYFDVTLTEWFRAVFGSYGALVESGSDVVLAETTAALPGLGALRRRARGLRRDRATRDHLDGRAVHRAPRRRGARQGRTVYVFVDPATMGKREIPALARERLAPYVNSTG